MVDFPTLTPLESALAGVQPRNVPRGGTPESSQIPILTPMEQALAGIVSAAPTPTTAPPTRPSILGEFGRGVQAGVRQIGADITATGAAGATLFGAEESATELARIAQGIEADIAREFPRTVARVEDIGSAGDLARFTARTLGEQVPIIASIMLGGGFGGLVGRMVGRGLISRGVGVELASRVPTFAAGAGAVGMATGLETGATALELLEATGRIDPGLAFSAGIAKGALEAIVPAAFGARFGLTPDLSRGLLGKMINTFDRVVPRRLAAATAAGTVETATEALQETIDISVRSFVDEHFDALGPEGQSRLLNAAAAGGLVGFVFGGLAGGGIRQPTGGVPEAQVPGAGAIVTPAPTGAEPLQLPPPPGLLAPPPQDTTPTDVAPELPETIFVAPTGPGQIVPEGGALSDAIAVVSLEGPQDLLVFEPPARAQARQAAIGARNARTVRIDVDRLTAEEVSADLTALPSEIEISDPRVSFVNPETRDEALAAAQLAVRIRDLEIVDAVGGVSEAQPLSPGRNSGLLTAQRRLNDAIELGFRYFPREEDGFILARSPTEGELVEAPLIARQPVPARAPNVFIEGTEVSTLDETGVPGSFVPFGITGRALTQTIGGGQAGASARSFEVDLTKLPEGQVSAAGPDTFVFSKIGKRLRGLADPEPIRTLRQFEQAIAASSEVSFAKGTKQVARRRIFSLAKSLAGNAPAFGMKQEFAQALALGLRVVPKGNEGRVFFGASRDIPTEAIIREVPGAPLFGSAREPRHNARTDTDMEVALQRATATTLDGKEYSLEAHAPGTVAIVQGFTEYSRTDLRELRRIEKLYNAWMRKFGMTTQRLVLYGNTLGPGFNVGASAGTDGMLSPFGTSTGAIGLDLARRDVDRVKFDSVAAHEFGHFIAFTELVKEDASVIELIISAYNRALVKGSLSTGGDFLRTFSSPERIRARIGRTEAELPIGGTGFGQNPSYWLSFDEWFAEQVARWATTFDRKPIDSVERFFARVARKVRELFKRLASLRGENIKDFRAEPEMEAWLASLQTRNRDTIQQVAVENVQLNSLDDTADLFSMDTAATAPHTAASANMRTLFGKLGIKGKDAKRAAADADHFNWLVRWGWNLMQLADKNRHIAGLQRYRELIDEWWVFKMNWINRADTRVREWRALGKGQTDNLAQFIFEIDGMGAWPTTDQLAGLVRKHKLEQPTLELYQRIRDDFAAVLEQMEKTSIRDVRATITSRVEQELEITKVRDEFSKLRAQPYFPHSRFGDFAIVVKNSEGQTVFMEQFQTQREARVAVADVIREFPDHRVRIDKIPKEVQPFRGIPPSLLRSMRNRLNLTEQQKVWLDQLIVDFLPSKSFRKRLQRRKDIPGFSLDAMRSYGNYFFHGANYLARIEFFDPLQQEINALAREAGSLPGAPANIVKRRQIIDFITRHFDYTMNPMRDWAALRSFAFQWWLGFSPASAAVNLTQIPMVAWPYLSARFGDVKAANELKNASLSIHKIYMNKEGTVPDDELWAVNRGIQQGPLDESQATELAGVAEGDVLQRLLPGNKFHRLLMQSAHWSAFLFQTSEKINRRIVFRAAYRLAKQNQDAPYIAQLRQDFAQEFARMSADGIPDWQAAAYLAGKDAVNRTQFEYAQHARPEFMRGRKGTVLTFFMFVQNMVWFAAHSPGRTRFLLMMLFMAGLMGLPGAEDLAALAKLAGRQLLGKDFDVEREVREMVAELVDEDSVAADLILHGASRVGFGLPHAADAMGIPFPMFDLSANISMGQIVPGVAELGTPGLDFEERFSRVSTDIAGAAFGIGINLAKFLSDTALPLDDAKRWERAMPRAIRNVVRAARFAEEGRERTRTGATVIDFDMTDPTQAAEVFAQAIGLTPTRLSRRWDRETMRREAEAYWAIRNRMLLQAVDHAFVVGDKEAQRDAITAIRRFNDEVPFAPMKITSKQVRESRRARIRARRLFELGLPSSRRLIPLAREVQRLTPEVDVDVQDVSRLR